jgi:hypothetical protein
LKCFSHFMGDKSVLDIKSKKRNFF